MHGHQNVLKGRRMNNSEVIDIAPTQCDSRCCSFQLEILMLPGPRGNVRQAILACVFLGDAH